MTMKRVVKSSGLDRDRVKPMMTCMLRQLRSVHCTDDEGDGWTYRVEEHAKLEDRNTQDLRNGRVVLTGVLPSLITDRRAVFGIHSEFGARLFRLDLRVRERLCLGYARVGERILVRVVNGAHAVGGVHVDTPLGEVGGTDTEGEELRDKGEEERGEADAELDLVPLDWLAEGVDSRRRGSWPMSR